MSMAHRMECNVATMAEFMNAIGETLSGAAPATALAVVLVVGCLTGLLASIQRGTRAVR